LRKCFSRTNKIADLPHFFEFLDRDISIFEDFIEQSNTDVASLVDWNCHPSSIWMTIDSMAPTLTDLDEPEPFKDPNNLVRLCWV